MTGEREDEQFRRFADMIQTLIAGQAKPKEYPTDSESIEVAIKRMNERYALVRIAGKLRVLEETTDSRGRPDLEFMTLEAFAVWEGVDKYRAGRASKVNIGAIYLTHRQRRQYRGFIFAPDGGPEGFLNLWRGYTVEPSEGELEKLCPTFWDHLTVNICAGDPARLRYLLAWFAHMIQKPQERPGVALVLRGEEGTGKTILGAIVGSLLGVHYVLIDDPRYLVGQFNAFMASTLLLQCDEGFWAGDKASEGRLKGLITSDTQMIEYKGVDPVPLRNLIRLLITSNEAWVVPAGAGARRFAVYDVANHSRGNAEYFSEVMREMEAGGKAALLGFLQRFDLAGIDLRDIPTTGGLVEQKELTMPPEVQWLQELLVRGTPTRGTPEWSPDISCDHLYGDYIAFAERINSRYRVGPNQLWVKLKKYVPGERLEKMRVRRPVIKEDGKGVKTWELLRFNIYQLPELEVWRDHFAGQFGLPFDWFHVSDEVEPEDVSAHPREDLPEDVYTNGPQV